MRALLSLALLVMAAGCAAAVASPDADVGGDGGGDAIDTVDGGACVEGATRPTMIACMCGGSMPGTCNCVRGVWACPLDCYPDRCLRPDAAPDAPPDAAPDSAPDTGASECAGARLPGGACSTEGARCSGGAYCNPVIPLSCVCTSGHWACDRTVCI